MNRLLGTLVSRAVRRGIAGEPLWLAVAAAAWLVRRSRRTDPDPLWRGRLRPGEHLDVRVHGPEGPVGPAVG